MRVTTSPVLFGDHECLYNANLSLCSCCEVAMLSLFLSPRSHPRPQGLRAHGGRCVSQSWETHAGAWTSDKRLSRQRDRTDYPTRRRKPRVILSRRAKWFHDQGPRHTSLDDRAAFVMMRGNCADSQSPSGDRGTTGDACRALRPKLFCAEAANESAAKRSFWAVPCGSIHGCSISRSRGREGADVPWPRGLGRAVAAVHIRKSGQIRSVLPPPETSDHLSAPEHTSCH